MNKNKDTFYRYQGFSSTTLDSLCRDEIYFANPGSFNDPLDCNPTLECDSSNDELRKLVSFLLQRRINKEILTNLGQASLKGEKAEKYAQDRARSKVIDRLKSIAYHEFKGSEPFKSLEVALIRDKGDATLLIVIRLQYLNAKTSQNRICRCSSPHHPKRESPYG